MDEEFALQGVIYSCIYSLIVLKSLLNSAALPKWIHQCLFLRSDAESLSVNIHHSKWYHPRRHFSKEAARKYRHNVFHDVVAMTTHVPYRTTF